MNPVTFNDYELGQLVVAVGKAQLGKLSPELRDKLHGVMHAPGKVLLTPDEHALEAHEKRVRCPTCKASIVLVFDAGEYPMTPEQVTDLRATYPYAVE